jgi:hypothetical protein
VDVFDQDHSASKRHEGTVISLSFLATERDTFESFEFGERLLDPCPTLVQFGCEETRDVFASFAIGNYWANAALASGKSICLGIIALVSNCGAWMSVRANFEQGREESTVMGLPPSEQKGDRPPIEIALEVDLRGKATSRTPEGLILLPLLIPQLKHEPAPLWNRTSARDEPYG